MASAQKPSYRWRLVLGSELMAELLYESYATPWISVSVQPGPGLAPFLPYFGDNEAWRDDDTAIDDMLDEIKRRGGFKLIDDKGHEVAPFTLVNLDEAGGDLRC